MTPEERDRLSKLEEKVEGLDDWLRSIHADIKELNKAAHMGKGAWWLIIRIGAVLAAFSGAAAWVIDHLAKK